MSTWTKTRNTIRQGGPGASHENAKTPLQIKPPPDGNRKRYSNVSGGGGEHDVHHTHRPEWKGGRNPFCSLKEVVSWLNIRKGRILPMPTSGTIR
jgi:hypothetical protein